MCDSFVALADITLNKAVIFGKNSDRPNGECQDVIAISSRDYPSETILQCTYLNIPQVKHTFAVILSKPSWMWGTEMGANEQGVVIGNEAVWTTQSYGDTGLLGMDLVRLGLERGESAAMALNVIVELLGEYGQGGNCAEHFDLNYHNSFLIADKNEAWVLETAGEYWVAERITSGTRSISNNLSIHGGGDMRHPDLDCSSTETVKAKNNPGFDFARYFSNVDNDEVTPNSREGRVRLLCRSNENNFTEETARSILQDHDTGICMHGEFETRGSQISVLSKESCKHWFIERPFPCQSEYQLKTIPGEYASL